VLNAHNRPSRTSSWGFTVRDCGVAEPINNEKNGRAVGFVPQQNVDIMGIISYVCAAYPTPYSRHIRPMQSFDRILADLGNPGGAGVAGTERELRNAT
jgi:hypothetical protein